VRLHGAVVPALAAPWIATAMLAGAAGSFVYVDLLGSHTAAGR